MGKYSFPCLFSGRMSQGQHSLFNFLGWCFSATFTARLVSFSSEVLRRGCFQANNDSPVQFFGGGCFWAASTPAARLVQVSGFELPLRRAHSTILEHTISVKGVSQEKRGGMFISPARVTCPRLILQ